MTIPPKPFRPPISPWRKGWRGPCLLLATLAAATIAAPPLEAASRRVPRPRPVANEMDTKRQQMEEAERARAAGVAAQQEAAGRAEKAAAEEKRVAEERADALRQLRANEAKAATLAGSAEDLAAQVNAAEQQLMARSADLAVLLPLIIRLSRHPAETMLAVQPDQGRALLGLAVLRGMTTRFERESAFLREDQARLAEARERLGVESLRLRAALAEQTALGASLDRQLDAARATRQAQENLAESAARQAAAQAARADTLRAAIEALEARRKAAEEAARAEAERAKSKRLNREAAAARRLQAALARPSGAGTIAADATPRGQLFHPVGGAVVRRFGASTDAGPATGLTFRPAPRATVVSPCAGRVAFAAPFRSYGPLLIVDCGGPYHGVLAGMERLDVQVGHTVAAGEKVGIMADWEPRSGDPRPTLYLELRRDGRPVDPTPWLAKAEAGEPG